MVACADVGNGTERIYWDELFEEVVFLWIDIISNFPNDTFCRPPHLLLPKTESHEPIFRKPRRQRIRTTIAIWAGIFFIILILVPTVCSIAYYCREDNPWPQNRYLEKFTNYDPTKDVLDIKSIDHENKIIHYYQYRNDPHDWTPEPAPPAASGSPQQRTITIDGKETTIDASPEEIISSMMDQVDYNEMLDFYGDPELR